VDFGDNIIAPQEFSASENILRRIEELLSTLSLKECAGREKNRILLPGFRVSKIETEFWKRAGWQIDDYLPYCGIHSTAAAFGIARALREKPSALFAHYNCHASGKQVLVLASTE
jgi:hypothetical protein